MLGIGAIDTIATTTSTLSTVIQPSSHTNLPPINSNRQKSRKKNHRHSLPHPQFLFSEPSPPVVAAICTIHFPSTSVLSNPTKRKVSATATTATTITPDNKLTPKKKPLERKQRIFSAKFHCELYGCDKSFHIHGYLQTHMRKHTGD